MSHPSRTTVGDLLRGWRASRGLSQLALSLSSGVSTRHISCVETGKSQPSRELVGRLSETLELSLRDRNALLIAAGYAPAFAERPLAHRDLAPVRRALDLVLASHEPYPAFVIDRAWNILLANDAHRRILTRLLPDAKNSDTVNVVRLVLDPGLLRPSIENWDVVAAVLGRRLQRELRAPALPAVVREGLESLLALPGVEEATRTVEVPPDASVVVPLTFVVDGMRTSWFSLVATIATPRDVTLDDLRIESMFPADAATARAADALAGADQA